ncbi:MAG: hypothetical protein QG597_2492 [Actinomycetota bacterium]|nr:hypothetical protein [Actinomycetota bacterium]
MPVGPVEVIVVKFPGSEFNGDIAPALADVVEQGDIRILDLVFVVRTSEEEIEIIELDDLEDDAVEELSEGTGSVVDLLSDEDLDFISDELEVGSSAVAVVFEHAWAARLAAALRGSSGEVVLDERIPADVVEAALELTGDEA